MKKNASTQLTKKKKSKSKGEKPKTSQDRGRSRTPAKEINKRPPIGDPKPNPNEEVID